MKSYFKKMPLFGRALPEQKREDVENIRNIFDVEDIIVKRNENAKEADFPTEKINVRGKMTLWQRLDYHNPKSICPQNQMLLPRVIKG